MFKLIAVRVRMLAHSVVGLRQGGFLKFAVVLFFGVGLVASLFYAISQAFLFLKGYPDFQAQLAGYLFSVYFMTMLLMLTFSNAIIAFGALFRSRETQMLLALPLSHHAIFNYKAGESLIFSSWAFLVLGGPLTVAYGLYGGVGRMSPAFYPAAFGLMVPFVFIPASAGSLLGMLITRYFPRNRVKVMGLGLAVLVAMGAVLFIRSGLIKYKDATAIDEALVGDIFRSLSFSQSSWFPSWWVSEGILEAAKQNWPMVAFYGGLLATTALFLWMLAEFVAEKLYASSYSRALGTPSRRIYRLGGALDWAGQRLSRLAPFTGRMLVKDIRTFVRDPVQWSQVVIFFGLLFLYVANLRNLGYQKIIVDQLKSSERWANFVAFTNLAAAGLTLATLTTRFVFPLVSMEGRRFWILGLLPMARSRILWGKYLFALLGSLLLLVPLVALSSRMLGSMPQMAWMHVLTALAMCLGLPGIAVGMGALFPNFHEETPSKIVSGFGGTVCLILSVGFVAAMVMGMGFFCRQETLLESEGIQQTVRHPLLLGASGALVLAGLTAVLPMWLGARAINKAEL